MKFFVQVTAWRYWERSYELLELYRAILKQQFDVSLFCRTRNVLSYRSRNIRGSLSDRVSLEADSYRRIDTLCGFLFFSGIRIFSRAANRRVSKEKSEENFRFRYFSIFSINILDAWRECQCSHDCLGNEPTLIKHRDDQYGLSQRVNLFNMQFMM